MKLAKDYPIRLVCRLLDVPRSSVYYAAQPVPDDEAMLKTVLLDLAGQWPTYGYRRLTAMMRRLDWPGEGSDLCHSVWRLWLARRQLSFAAQPWLPALFPKHPGRRGHGFYFG